MSAYLRVEGEELDVDQLLAQLDLTPSVVGRRGEQNRLGRRLDISFLSFAVSEASLQDAEQQIDDALKFVEHFKADLEVLAHFPGADYRFIDFGIEHRNVAHHVDVMPRELLAALGRFRIDLHVSRYPRTPPEDSNSA